MTTIALIFDMDGVLVDNLQYHVEAWLAYCRKHDIPLTREEFFEHLNGKNARDTFEYFYKKPIDTKVADELNEEKEILYREIYKDHIKPAEGLITLLKDLKSKGVKLAVGTSAAKNNIDFTLDNTGIREYFDEIIDSSMVKKGKPFPDIYLKAAEKLGVPPTHCVVAEDALMGIQAGLSAGMKVIGVTTSHTAQELSHTDLQVQDFREVTYESLLKLLSL